MDASYQLIRNSTRDVSPRVCYPPRRAPRRSEAFRCWYAASLSTLYLPTTSESSSGDSSERPMHLSSHSAGPSRKRCRSPVDSVPLSTPASIEEDAEITIGNAKASPERSMRPTLALEIWLSVYYQRIKTAQRRLEADQLIASGDRARMAEMIYSLRLENLKVRAMLDIERDRVSSLRLHMSLSQEEFRQIRRDRDDARGRLRRLESYLGRRFGFRP
ncbi:hypothetical protein Tco_1578498 [Tanacetum coccineum]